MMISLNEISERAKLKENENYRFRTYLKMHADPLKLDEQFRELHEELFAIKRHRHNHNKWGCRNRCCGSPTFLSASLFAQLHHLWNNDVVDIDKEYNGCYYLNASFYPLMSELMLE